MTDIVIIFAIIIFVILTQGCKDFLSRILLMIFGGFWFFSLIGTQFQVQELFLPQESTILICLAGIFSFTIGFLCIRISSNCITQYNPVVLKNSIDRFITSTFFKVTLIFATFFVVIHDFLLYKVVIINAAMSAGELRGSTWGDESIYGPLFNSTRAIIFSWYIPLIRALFCYSLFFKRDRFTIIMLVLLFGYTILDVGRFGFIRALIPLIAVIGLFQYAQGRGSLLKEQKKVLWGIFGMTFAFIILVSSLRAGESSQSNAVQKGWDTTIEHIVSYSIGPIVAFDQQINSDFIDRIGGYGYGSISLWPFMTPAYRLKSDYTSINPNFVKFRQESEDYRISIGKDIGWWNGLYTWNLNFYSDGGVLGVILLNFLFGLLMRLSIKWTYHQETIYSFVLCTMILSFIVQAPLKLCDYAVYDPLFIIVLIILSKVQSSHHLQTQNIAIQ